MMKKRRKVADMEDGESDGVKMARSKRMKKREKKKFESITLH